MGEDVLTMVVASGAGAGAMTLALARARLGELLNRLRQWR
jgi:tRNA A58 N-methylase Trm61